MTTFFSTGFASALFPLLSAVLLVILLVLVSRSSAFKKRLRRLLQLVENLLFGHTDAAFPLVSTKFQALATASRRTAIEARFNSRENISSIYKRTKSIPTASSSDNSAITSPNSKAWIAVVEEDDDSDQPIPSFIEPPPSFVDYFKSNKEEMFGIPELLGELTRLTFEVSEGHDHALLLGRVVDAAILADRRYAFEYREQMRQAHDRKKAESNGLGYFETEPFFDNIWVESKPNFSMARWLFGERLRVVIEAQPEFIRYFKAHLAQDRLWFGVGIHFLESQQPRTTHDYKSDRPICNAVRCREKGLVGARVEMSAIVQRTSAPDSLSAYLTSESATGKTCPSKLDFRKPEKGVVISNLPPVALLRVPLSLPCGTSEERESCGGGEERLGRLTRTTQLGGALSKIKLGAALQLRSRVQRQWGLTKVTGAHYDRSRRILNRFPTLHISASWQLPKVVTDLLLPSFRDATVGTALLAPNSNMIEALCIRKSETGKTVILPINLLARFWLAFFFNVRPPGFPSSEPFGNGVEYQSPNVRFLVE